MSLIERYRKGVGICILNEDSLILTCKRKLKKGKSKEGLWQMPQGGVKNFESTKDAMFRELFEEVGLKKNDVTFVRNTDECLSYKIPKNINNSKWKDNYIGQKQIWFLLKIKNSKNINLKNEDIEQEFEDFKWMTKDEITDSCIFFKKSLYEKVFKLLCI